MFRTIRWRIAVPFILLILIITTSLTLYHAQQARREYVATQQEQLASAARLLRDLYEPALTRGDTGVALAPLVQRHGDLLGMRVTVIAADGVVRGDSAEDWQRMDNHLGRTEVQYAILYGQGVTNRYSQTLGQEMMYLALPVRDAQNTTVGVVRVALPLQQIEANVLRTRLAALIAAAVATAAALLLALSIAEHTTRPLHRLNDTVQRLAAGDLTARLFPTTHDEVGTLTQSFNNMADQLRNTIASLEREHARLAAVLQYMADGVLITDDTGIVRQANPAALRLLDSSESAAIGRSLAQAVRDHQIIALWQRAQELGIEQSETVDTGRQRPFLRVVVTPLRQTQTAAFLVVLQDLTQIRRLETVRRDFISNISHELRTPLAALKALTETLRDGALEDPPAAQRFLERMDGEVDTMAQMVQELLELARIESGQVPLRLSPATVEEVILSPLERLQPQAVRARLELEVSLPPSLPRVWADVERAQQVVSNLVHNALKFTPAGGHITLSAYTQGNEVIITVRDTGIGIAADALPRVFERFFKADRARSGGGTGLGLAIAKHIVQSHGGRIWVESREGEGSLFSFSLAVNETLTRP